MSIVQVFLVFILVISGFTEKKEGSKSLFNEMVEYEVHNMPYSTLLDVRLAIPKMHDWKDIVYVDAQETLTIAWIPQVDKQRFEKLLVEKNIEFQEMTEDTLFSGKMHIGDSLTKQDQSRNIHGDLLPDLSFSGLITPKSFGIGDNRFQSSYKIPSYLADTKLTDFTRIELH